MEIFFIVVAGCIFLFLAIVLHPKSSKQHTTQLTNALQKYDPNQNLVSARIQTKHATGRAEELGALNQELTARNTAQTTLFTGQLLEARTRDQRLTEIYEHELQKEKIHLERQKVKVDQSKLQVEMKRIEVELQRLEVAKQWGTTPEFLE